MTNFNNDEQQPLSVVDTIQFDLAADNITWLEKDPTKYEDIVLMLIAKTVQTKEPLLMSFDDCQLRLRYDEQATAFTVDTIRPTEPTDQSVKLAKVVLNCAQVLGVKPDRS